MEREGDDRRSFLKHIVAGTAAVAVTAAMIKPATSKSLPAACRPPESLYQESEYFKQYYKSLRS